MKPVLIAGSDHKAATYEGVIDTKSTIMLLSRRVGGESLRSSVSHLGDIQEALRSSRLRTPSWIRSVGFTSPRWWTGFRKS